MSRLERAKFCPGSPNAERGKPDENNAIATSGTKIHDALESGDCSALSDDELKLADRARELREETVERFIDDDGPFTVLKEKRFWGIDEEASGQIDYLLIKDNRALVIDYKTGFLESVESGENMQLKGYAVLIKEAHPHFEEIEAVIIQPRVWPEISKSNFKLPELQSAREEISDIIEKTKDPKAKRIPGPEQCKYCKAKADCPEARELALSLSNFEPLELPSERLPELLDACSAAKKIIGAIESRAKALLELDSCAVAGYALKQGASMSKVSNPQKLFNRMNEKHSVLPHEFVQVCDVAKGKLKALLKEASGLKGKALDEELKALLDGVTKETQKAASLVKK